MNMLKKLAMGAALMGGLLAAATIPASAGIGFSIGIGGPAYYPYGPGYYGPNNCAYYDYYGAPPPGACSYQLYYGPVFWDGYWYQGPIYYRWWQGRRWFWLNNGWHDWDHARWNGWEGERPYWRGWHGSIGWYQGGHDWHGDWRGGGDHWRGGDHDWRGGGGHDWHGGDDHDHHH